MLYHWYELDPEATVPTDADVLVRPSPFNPIARFDRTSAIACASGDVCQLRDDNFPIAADNDTKPDPIALRLREAGLGVLGNPAHKARPGDYGIVHRAQKLWSSVVSMILDAGTVLPYLIRRACRYTIASCSHMMVLNGTDDVVARDGAPQQRLGASSGQ